MEKHIKGSVYAAGHIGKCRPESSTHAAQLRLSPLLLVVLVILTGFGVAIMSVLAWAKFTPVPPNPSFPAYADVFPGQPASAVKARAFTCRSNNSHDYYSEVTHCTYSPTDGIFSSVEAILSEGMISSLTFTMRDATLKVGDLILLLKTPMRHCLQHTGYFFLPGNIAIAKTSSRTSRFPLFSFFESVTFIK